MKIIDNDFDDIFFSQFTSLLGGIVAGAILATHKGNIFEIPGMLILIPGLLEVRGSICGSFASRLSSGLFLGIIDPKKILSKIVNGNFLATIIQAASASAAVGLVAFLVNFLILGSFNPGLILIALITGIVANLIQVPITLLLSLFYFKKGHDPNNFIGPLITSMGDVVSMVALVLTIQLI